MGWSADQILGLFRDPFYPVLHGLRQALGDDELRNRIATVVETFGVFRFRSTIDECSEDAETEAFDDLLLEQYGT